MTRTGTPIKNELIPYGRRLGSFELFGMRAVLADYVPICGNALCFQVIFRI